MEKMTPVHIKIILILLCWLHVGSPSTYVYEGEDCKACLDDIDNFAGVCRSTSDTQSYCCTQDEIDSPADRTCGNSDLCSTSIDAINLRPITCPHKKYRCGISDPDIPLYTG